MRVTLVCLLLACGMGEVQAPSLADAQAPTLVIATRTDNGRADTSLVTLTGSTGQLAGRADDFVESIGVAAHWDRRGGVYGNPAVQQLLCESGIRSTREQMMDKADAQRVLRELARCGVRMTAGCWPAGNFDDASRCLALADAYGDSVIAAFDGWNEVDNRKEAQPDWPDKFRRWQVALWAAYKQHPTWKDRPLYSNTVAHAGDALTVYNQEGNLSAWTDYGNLHSYPGSGSLPGTLGAWDDNFNQLVGPKPLVATETGYHNAVNAGTPGISELAHGKYIPRLYFEYWNQGIRRTHVYEFADEGPTPYDGRESAWGMVRYNGTPKPAYTAVKNVIALLADPGASWTAGRLDYTLTGKLASTHTTLLQKRDGRFYLVLWQELKSWNNGDVTIAPDAVTLTLPAPATFAVYRPRLGAAPIQTGSGTSLALSVPDEVLMVEIVP